MSTFDDAEHRGLRELLGSYALGHLTDMEADALRAHLDGCADCRAELEELLPVARALDAVDAEAFSAPAPIPLSLGEDVRRAVAAARAERDADELDQRRAARALGRRRLRVQLLGAAAAVVVALGVGGAVGRATAPELPVVPKEAISLEIGSGDDVTVESADLVAHTWGVELQIVAEGFTEGETFRAEFRTDDGELVPAGEFRGVGGSPMTCYLQSATLREDVTQVLVIDSAGETVLSSDL